MVTVIHHTSEGAAGEDMLMEAMPRRVHANNMPRRPVSALHISSGRKLFFVILGKREIELALNSRINAPLSKINTKETILSKRTTKFGMIFNLMIFTMASTL